MVSGLTLKYFKSFPVNFCEWCKTGVYFPSFILF